ncbi:Os02g0660450 [Oryza sativa Japonica Group]|uniref:Os02g0660450 protein n=1 Tax=Oryza sativa subsp. japonica TaxID=39947 RepID=A0A0P0VMY5_ORYSJ|nr:Os02g0660450 [Oryza sativa Japonica Group]
MTPRPLMAAPADDAASARGRPRRQRRLRSWPPPPSTPHPLVTLTFTIASEPHPSDATVGCVGSPSLQAYASITTSRLMRKAMDRERWWSGREVRGGTGEGGEGDGAAER